MVADAKGYQIVLESSYGEHSSLFSRLSGKFRIARRATNLRRELEALSERDLDDIGLSRGDIPALARKTAAAGR